MGSRVEDEGIKGFSVAVSPTFRTAILESTLPDATQRHRVSSYPTLRHEVLHLQHLLISEYDHITRLPIIVICLAAVGGIGLGVLMDSLHVPTSVVMWIALPGDLFIDALKALVGPLVFCSIIICIGELITLGKVRAIATRTVVYFLLCSVLSASIGVLMGWLFLGCFQRDSSKPESTPSPMIVLTCPSGGVVSMDPSSAALACIPHRAASSLFKLQSLAHSFIRTSTPYEQMSVTDQLIKILELLIPQNIVEAFTSTTTMGITMFSILLGAALAQSVNRETENYPLLLIRHASAICRLLINYVLWFVPVAIVSMIGGSIAKVPTSLQQFGNVGWLLLAVLAGLLLLTIGILGTVFYITTRTSIFRYLKHIVPSMVFIFGCSSSIATLPINLRCVENSREVSPALFRFVLPIGATCNLNGTAVYMPLACIFMAKVSGHEDMLTMSTYMLLVVIGAISSFGVAPVPHAGLVMTMTIWRSVFGMDLPRHAFALLVSAEWLLNRLRSIVNITNDTIICRIIAEQCEETEFQRPNQTILQPSECPMRGDSRL